MGSGKRLAAGLTSFACVCALALPAAAAAQEADPLSEVGHVFTIVLENKDYDITFGAEPPAPYLAKTLAGKGQLLTQYHGTGHFSLGNYITMISGQSENPRDPGRLPVASTSSTPGTIGADGQALGERLRLSRRRCMTVADQLEAAGQGWRGYMEDMGDDLARDGGTRCAHPPIGAADRHPEGHARPTSTRPATTRSSTSTRSSTTAPPASAHVVNLRRLRHDLRKPHDDAATTASSPPTSAATATTRSAPNPAQPGGYAGIDASCASWVPRILKLEGLQARTAC